MKLTIVIPAYNEEHTIVDVIQNIPKVIDGVSEINTVVVDDGSTDATRTVAENAGVEVLSHYRNLGVGQSMRDGIEYSVNNNSDILVTIDADGQFDPEDIPTLIAPILHNKTLFVTCSRFIAPAFQPPMPLINIVGNKMLAWFVSQVIGVKVWDVSCGFRAYSRDVLLRLNLFGKIDCNQEMFINLARHNIVAKEIPLKVSQTKRAGGESRVVPHSFRFILRLGMILLRSLRDANPFVFFGFPGAILLFIGVLLYGLHWFVVLNGLRPLLSNQLGTVGWGLALIGFILLLFAMFADMVDRVRITQEEALYRLKKK